ncbi:uncharacterized protein LOC129249969 [Anastrepha obliqua]|uniref:uncharacterized protein LOC129249969 n=1 Tax=Anastrepha obliqua TaxID=95512 RepID=UPI002409DFA1|nr:uncharacterized protein LOC129249969 [Anastrepha obliqua]
MYKLAGNMKIRTITNVSTAKSQHYNSHNNIDSNNKKDREIRKSNSAKMPTIKLGQHKKRSLMHARFVGVEINTSKLYASRIKGCGSICICVTYASHLLCTHTICRYIL